MFNTSSWSRKRWLIPGQPKKIYDALTSSKKYILFTEEEGAEEHCQTGSLSLSNQRIFDWLDETFQNRSS